MVVYPDTSFLVPLYIKEDISPVVTRHLDVAQEPLCFTPLHRLELRTALRLRAFRNENPPAEIKLVLRRMDEDLVQGPLRHVPLVWADALREAERIGEAHLAEIGARSFDLLHVASAVVLGAREFLTFDQRQTKLARRVGLKVRSWTAK